MRAAMVYHYSPAGISIAHEMTFDQDWVAVRRDGVPVPVDPTPVPIEWGRGVPWTQPRSNGSRWWGRTSRT